MQLDLLWELDASMAVYIDVAFDREDQAINLQARVCFPVPGK